MRRLGKVAAAGPRSSCWSSRCRRRGSTFLHSERDVVIGAHDATVQPAFGGHATLDFGRCCRRSRLPLDAPAASASRSTSATAEVAGLEQMRGARRRHRQPARGRDRRGPVGRSSRWLSTPRCAALGVGDARRAARGAGLDRPSGRARRRRSCGALPDRPSRRRRSRRRRVAVVMVVALGARRGARPAPQPTHRRGRRSHGVPRAARRPRCSTPLEIAEGAATQRAAGRSSRARWPPTATRSRSTASSRSTAAAGRCPHARATGRRPRSWSPTGTTTSAWTPSPGRSPTGRRRAC